MGIQIQGNGGVVAEVDGTVHRSQRVSVRPLDHGTLGHYTLPAATGLLPAALGANSEIFQFRWADATRFCVVFRVRISAAVSTTFFAAGVPVHADMVRASAWTVAGTGGTAITMGTNGRRRISGMGSSLIPAGDIRIATTAALGAGTKTLEGSGMANLLAAGPITGSLNGTIFAPGTVLFEARVGDGEHPPAFAQNEGFVVRSVAVPATGTWQASVIVDYAEVAAY